MRYALTIDLASLKQHLLLFDGMECSFHKVKLRPSQKNCIACGDGSKPKLIDYEQFCGSQSNDKVGFYNVTIFPFRSFTIIL